MPSNDLPDDLPGDLLATVCAAEVECGTYPDAATCTEALDPRNLAVHSSMTVEELIANIEAGLIRYDPEAAERCLALRRESFGSCKLLFPEQSEELKQVCNSAFAGTVPLERTCSDDEQCAGQNSECNIDETTCDVATGCCTGRCEPLGPEPPAEIGEECDLPGRFDCVSGAYCHLATNTCQALIAVGDACSEEFACVSPALCTLDHVGEDPVRRCVIPSGPGEACVSLNIRACEQGDYFCEDDDLVCRRRPGAGNSCTPNGECLPYAYCNNGRCASRPALGDACDGVNGPNCMGALTCRNAVCIVNTSAGGSMCPLP